MYRKNGFQLPIPKQQILVIFSMLLSIFSFIQSCFYLRPHLAHSIVVVIYFIVSLLVTTLFFKICLIDPAHSDIGKSVKENDENEKPGIICRHCKIKVTHGTRHCRICNKCVQGFDHHCLYLNTCVGSKNYNTFVVLLVSSILMLLIQNVCSFYAMFQTADLGRGILLFILTVIPFISCIAMLLLLLFHSYIYIMGMTTYQWIAATRIQHNTKSVVQLHTEKKKEHRIDAIESPPAKIIPDESASADFPESTDCFPLSIASSIGEPHIQGELQYEENSLSRTSISRIFGVVDSDINISDGDSTSEVELVEIEQSL